MWKCFELISSKNVLTAVVWNSYFSCPKIGKNQPPKYGTRLVLSGPAHPNSRGLLLDTFRPWYVSAVFFFKNQENIPSFQSTHFTRKYPRDLLRLKLEIVNTANFRLILGLIWGYEY